MISQLIVKIRNYLSFLDPEITIISPKAQLTGMICYGTKRQSYCTYLIIDNEWVYFYDK